MSHYLTYVVLPPGTDEIEEAVAKIMAPFNEDLEIEWYVDPGYPDEAYWRNPRGFWDWWQLGGRWTGYLSDYDPHEDPANKEPCDHYGHGVQNCHYCDGTGLRLKWPTDWRQVDSDRIATEALAVWLQIEPDKMPYTFICGETVLHKEVRNPDWDRTVLNEQGFSDYSNYMIDTPDYEAKVIDALRRAPEGCMVVVVDYHN